MSALYDYQLEGLGGYQEFDRYPGEETVYVDCPTCRGKGRINMSSEKNQLISLGEDWPNADMINMRMSRRVRVYLAYRLAHCFNWWSIGRIRELTHASQSVR